MTYTERVITVRVNHMVAEVKSATEPSTNENSATAPQTTPLKKGKEGMGSTSKMFAKAGIATALILLGKQVLDFSTNYIGETTGNRTPEVEWNNVKAMSGYTNPANIARNEMFKVERQKQQMTADHNSREKGYLTLVGTRMLLGGF